MSDYPHLSLLSREQPIKLVYRFIEGTSSKFWSIERPCFAGPLQVRFGRIGSAGQVTNVGISLREVLTRRDEKVGKGYYFSPENSSELISHALKGTPFADIRSFLGNWALDGAGERIMEVPPEEKDFILGRYLMG
jgi:predicted DNA-binding WGR domain protein